MRTAYALEAAEQFITGFEDDSLQEGVEDLLAKIRDEILRRKMTPQLICKRPKAHRVSVHDGGNFFSVYAKGGRDVSYFLRQKEWHLWYGTIYIYDDQGGQWQQSTGSLVQDDFGNLVEVAA